MTSNVTLLVTTIAALAAMCVAILAIALAARRWGMPWMAKMGQSLRGERLAPRIEVLERIALEPRRSLYLVKADGKTMLLGASDAAVTLIAEMPGGDAGHG